jgi:hypothetical protein
MFSPISLGGAVWESFFQGIHHEPLAGTARVAAEAASTSSQ